MMKAYKYRIYPTSKQTAALQWTLDRCRELYNAALQERKEAYKYAKKTISAFEQMRSLTEIKAEVRTEYQEIGSHVLQDVIKRIDKAFKAFFRRIKNGETPGYPRFQGRDRYDSFCFPDASGWKLAIDEKGKGKLSITSIGGIKIKLHRPLEGKIKTTTIKREGEHWYAVFSCEVERVPQLAYSDEAIGIDLGLAKFATLSNGATIENPRYFRKGEKRLAKAQQALSRKKRGSKRRKKAVQKVSRAHRKVRNQRQDFLHKESHSLVRCYEVIVFEDIQPANLSKAPKPKQDENGKYLPNGASAKGGLNKSILDAGWSTFIAMCEYKAEYAGLTVLRVDPRYTSQVCSGCGTVRKKELSERWHSCECGCELDRDHNAALNILKRGLDAA
jgi:putative transposase